jgi:hypothetical protein
MYKFLFVNNDEWKKVAGQAPHARFTGPNNLKVAGAESRNDGIMTVCSTIFHEKEQRKSSYQVKFSRSVWVSTHCLILAQKFGPHVVGDASFLASNSLCCATFKQLNQDVTILL